MKCQFCDRSFEREGSLVRHTEEVHGRAGVYKGTCAWERSRSQSGVLTTGVAETDYCYEIEDSQYDGSRKGWVCSLCDKCFGKKRQLEQHLQSGVHEDARYACEGCSKTFPTLGALSNHLTDTGHSYKEARLIHVMVQEAQQPQLMITDGGESRFIEATLFFDGSAQSNPGAGGAGVHLVDDRGHSLYRGGFAVPCLSNNGDVTNNQAEYAALEHGLQIAIDEGIKRLRVKGDSELVINQMKGEYRCNSARLVPYYNAIHRLERDFHSVEYVHIPRSKNGVADGLAEENCKWV